jgi:hypothetical protein
MLPDKLACAPVLIVKPSGEVGEILAGQEGTCLGTIAFALGFRTDAPVECSEALSPVKLIEGLSDTLDLVLGHTVAVLPRRLPSYHCPSIPL